MLRRRNFSRWPYSSQRSSSTAETEMWLSRADAAAAAGRAGTAARGRSRRRDWPRSSGRARRPRRSRPAGASPRRSCAWRAPGTSGRRPARGSSSHSTGALVRPGEAVVDLLGLLGDVDVDRRGLVQRGRARRCRPPAVSGVTARSECGAMPRRTCGSPRCALGEALEDARVALRVVAGSAAGPAPAACRRSRRSRRAPAAG